MNDYNRIAKAIEFIRSHAKEQPSLERIAQHVSLSPFHFQRLFSRWAGVTPKRFLQALTLETAKDLLKNKDLSVMQATYETGLSSSSRLYDHFVQINAVTPAEYKKAGHGLEIRYGTHISPFGEVLVAITGRGICKLVFITNGNKSEPLNQLQAEWPNAELIEDRISTSEVIQRVFKYENNQKKPLSVLVRGTNFQVSVWQALLNIPQGQLVCYGDIANIIGKPKANRAVGTAIGANPIAFIIPCHRVIQQSGQLGGYRWGETRKHAMLVRESLVNETIP